MHRYIRPIVGFVQQLEVVVKLYVARASAWRVSSANVGERHRAVRRRSLMKIDVLYFAGCPNHEPTVRRVREIVVRLGIVATVNEIEVRQGDDLDKLRFAGSPTVLVNDQDIDPEVRTHASYRLGCRMFDGAGVPPAEMIERAIRNALQRGDLLC